MTEHFDPYHKWLGIPPEEQPPHCYRLLGLKPFETDPDVIDVAADRQMAHLRTYQSGEKSALSQRLLNEVSTARVCLLNPTQKAAYDAQLHEAFAQQSAVQQGLPVTQPLAEQSSTSQVEPAEEIDTHLIDLFEETKKDHDSSVLRNSGIRKRGKNSDIHHRGPGDSGVQQNAAAGDSGIKRNLAELKKRKTVMWIYAGCGAGALLTIVLLIVVVVSGSSSSDEGEPSSNDGMLIVELSPKERSAVTTLLIDGKKVSMTGTGPVEHKCPPGLHGIEIRRPGYRPYMKSLELESGGQQRISPKWKPRSQLNVEIPDADRGNAALQIDGIILDWVQDCHASDAAKVAFALEPGRHTVAISRAGYETDTQTIELAEGWSKTIKPGGLPQASGEPIDLLAMIDLDVHAVTPGWRQEGKDLISPSLLKSRVQIPVVPQGEYLVTADVECLADARWGLAIGLVADGHQFMAYFDGWDPARTALDVVDGLRGDANGVATWGRVLDTNKLATIKCYVVQSGVKIDRNDERLIDWSGKLDRLSMASDWPLPLDKALFIAAEKPFRISKLELTPISGTVQHLVLPTPRVVAEVDHRAGNKHHLHTFYSNGRIGAPLSMDRWSLDNDTLVFRWQDGHVDTCTLSTDRKSYEGRNSGGTAIAGKCRLGSFHGENPPAQPDTIAARRPVPSAAELAEVLKRIDNAYLAETADEKRKLAAQLSEKAKGISAESPERYGFYWRAIRLAEDGGDAQLALEVIDTIASEYEVDAFSERVTCLRKLADRAKDEATFNSLVEFTTVVTEEAIELEKYDLAKELVAKSYAAFPLRGGSQELRTAVYKRRQEINKLYDRWQEFLATKTRLETAPDVPGDNLIVGRWLCLQRGDWDAGLPYLIRSDDSTLREVARRDVGMPAESYATHLRLGDAYGRLADDETNAQAKTSLLLRAGHWYDKSLPHIVSVAAKDRLRSRLAEIETARQQRRGSGKKPDQPPTSVLRFDGDDYVSTELRYDGTKPLTIEAIVRPAATGYQTIVGNQQHSGLVLEQVDGYWRFSIHDKNGYQKATSDAEVKVSERAHLAGTFDGRQIRLFVNGRLQKQSATFQGPHRVSRYPFMIGADPGSLGQPEHFFQGTMEAVHICESILYATDFVPPMSLEGQPSSVLLYRFDQSKNGAANDESGKNNDGKVFGAKLIEVGAENVVAKEVKLVDLKPIASKVGWDDLWINRAPRESWPLIGEDFELCREFIYAHAPSALIYRVPRAQRSFTAIGYCANSRSVSFKVFADEKMLAESKSEGVVAINVDIPEGTVRLKLIADELGDRGGDHSYWCYPRFHRDLVADIGKEDKFIRVTQLHPETAGVGVGSLLINVPPKDVSAPVHYTGLGRCKEFIYAHADSRVIFEIPDGAIGFSAIGYALLSSSVKFQVFADSVPLFDSGRAGIAPIQVKIPKGAKTLVLVTDTLGDGFADHSYWCYPRFHLAPGIVQPK